MKEKTRGPLPPSLFLGALTVEWALHALLPLVRIIPDTLRVLGVIPMAAGLVLMVVADRQFKNVNTATKPFDSPSHLVTGGPFRISRNPMYLGMVVTLLGEAIAWGSLTPFLMVPVMVWVFTNRFIVTEEEALARVFGKAFAEYRGRVRRWL